MPPPQRVARRSDRFLLLHLVKSADSPARRALLNCSFAVIDCPGLAPRYFKLRFPRCFFPAPAPAPPPAPDVKSAPEMWVPQITTSEFPFLSEHGVVSFFLSKMKGFDSPYQPAPDMWVQRVARNDFHVFSFTSQNSNGLFVCSPWAIFSPRTAVPSATRHGVRVGNDPNHRAPLEHPCGP